MDLIYIWLDAKGQFRSKVKRLLETPHVRVPVWNYDGSSTGQATTENSEVLLEPTQTYADYKNKKVYVLCSTYDTDHVPVQPNTWFPLKQHEPALITLGLKLGFEQEFFVYDTMTQRPLDDLNTRHTEQGSFYCSVGTPGSGIYNRKLETMVRDTYERACALGISCTGYNLEVAPGQAEIQVCDMAPKACHDVVFLRYLLWDTLGKYSCYPVFHPKPLGSERNGSGLHTNISTFKTMEKGGYEEIKTILTKFEANHKDHLAVYGEDNQARLTGHHETSSMERFTWGVGSRAASVRIPYETAKNGCGYFEDRRPAANADPYLVCLEVWKSIQDIV